MRSIWNFGELGIASGIRQNAYRHATHEALERPKNSSMCSVKHDKRWIAELTGLLTMGFLFANA